MLQQGPAGLDVTGVVGYTCRRGKDYARQEATHPVRMVTAAVPVDGRLCPVSAKTAQPIAKNRMLAALEEIRAARAAAGARRRHLARKCCRHGCCLSGYQDRTIRSEIEIIGRQNVLSYGASAFFGPVRQLFYACENAGTSCMFLHVSTEYMPIILHQAFRFISGAPSFLADLCIKLKNSTIL